MFFNKNYAMVAVLNVLKDYLLAHIAESISLKLRTQLNSKISVMKYSYFDEHNLSEVLSKYNKEVDTVKENCGYMLVKGKMAGQIYAGVDAAGCSQYCD